MWFHPSLLGSGGGERLILEGMKAFEEMGLDATLLVLRSHGDEVYEGNYRPRVVSLNASDSERSAGYLRRILRLWRTLLTMRKQLQALQADMVVVQAQWGEAIPVYLATRFSSVQYVAYHWDSLFTYPTEQSKHALIFRRHFEEIRRSIREYELKVPTTARAMSLSDRSSLELRTLFTYLSVRAAQTVLVFSNQIKWEVAKLYGKNAFVSKGAFPRSIFQYKPWVEIKQKLALTDTRMVLSICRLIPKKRVDLSIRAFSRLCEEIDDAVLVIGGHGVEEQGLRDLTDELKLGSRVRFVGYVKEEELWDFYAAADLFVHMDLADFDIAPYEALALGSKVVWSTEMEVDETLKGNRLLFPADPNVEDVTRAMRAALTTPLEISPAEKALLRKYTWGNHFQRIVSEMERVSALQTREDSSAKFDSVATF